MTTAARPSIDRASHYYYPDGRPCYEVPKADGNGKTPTTVAHARKWGLLPSPTTILKLLAKPQLEAWKIEQGCLAVLTSPRRDGEELDAFVRRVLHEDREHEAERDIAAEIGSAIHEAVQLQLSDVQYDPAYRPYVDAVMKVLAPFGRVMFTEKVLVGDGYAGRADIGLESDSFITVVDLKGCKALPKYPYDEHLMQVGAYAGALGNTDNKLIQCAIVYINRNLPGEVKMFPCWPWEDEYKKFRALVKFWYLANGIELPLNHR